MQEYDMLGFHPKPQRGLRPLNTALHSAEIARLLAVFPRMMQSIILQRQFELIHLDFTPTPLSGDAPAGKRTRITELATARLLTVLGLRFRGHGK